MLGLPLRIYTLEQYKKGAIESPPFVALNGNHLKWPDSPDRMPPEELAKYLVGFFYVAAPDQFSADGLRQAASQLVNTTHGESNVPMLPVRGPNQVERYQERFYDAVSACHRDVVNEIGPPL